MTDRWLIDGAWHVAEVCRNPAVRGAAAEVLLAAVRRVGADKAALAHLGRTGLLQAGAALLTDKAPAARSSSRQVVQLLKVCALPPCSPVLIRRMMMSAIAAHAHGDGFVLLQSRRYKRLQA